MSALLVIENFRPHIFSWYLPWLDVTLAPRFYGLFYVLAILAGYKIISMEAKRRQLAMDEEQASNYVMLIFLGGLLGGRTYEVIFEWSHHYSKAPWTEIFAIWHGGLAIHGGILGGALAIWLYARRQKMRTLELMDMSVICLIFGQAIGRWGNFTNGEAAGPVTDFWAGVVFPPGSATYAYAQGQPVHPTMMYESLGNFVIFAILWKLRLQNFRPGMLVGIYLVLYALWRSLLTPLRMDNQFFELFGEKILAAYAIGLGMTITGLLVIWTQKSWQREGLSGSAVAGSTRA